MTTPFKTTTSSRSLTWVYPDHLTERLDSATWVETSRWLQRFGWQVTLLSRGEVDEVLDVRGVPTQRIRTRNVYLLGQVLFHADVVRQLLRNWQETDVVFFTQLSGFWLLPLRWARPLLPGKGPAIVMDTRDLDDPVPGSWRSSLRIRFHQLVFAMANRLADGQTSITPRMAQLVGTPERALLGYWPSGVDPQTFAAAAEKRVWPAKDDPIRLIYIGILLQKRNLEPLCQAVQQANAQGMHFELSLVGDGPARPDLARYVDDAIRIGSPVPHEQVPQMLGRAHVGVTSLPDPDDAKYQASSPIKLFEYMAAGMPVLATSNPCHTDVVGDGGYAFWAEEATVDSLYAALSDLWQAHDRLEELGREACVAAQSWTWEAAAAKLDSALEKARQNRSA